MSKVEITLRSGNLVVADVTAFTVQKNGLGSVVGMKWEAGENDLRFLQYLDISEVTSVIFVDD
jgi:hypothetical protein